MFRATMWPSSGADDYVVISPRVGIVPWLQEGCQNRLAGSVSIEEFVTQLVVLRTPASDEELTLRNVISSAILEDLLTFTIKRTTGL